VTDEAFLVDGARTPIGRYGGTLAPVRPDDLAAHAIRALVARHPQVDWAAVDDVVLGCANQAGEDNRNVARMALLLAGLPQEVSGTTVNRLCGSGADAVAIAARAVRAGETDLVVAGGVESMSRAPFVTAKAQSAWDRSVAFHDTTLGWRFVNPEMERLYGTDSMGETAENVAAEHHISRTDQDAFALRSQERTAQAQKDGRLAREIVAVEVPQRRGDPLTVTDDEGVREGTTAASLAKLRPAFAADGTVTAGSASQISDGAAAVVVMSRAKAEELGAPILAEIGAHGNVAGPDASLLSQPANAILKALGREGRTAAEVDLFEINEAFAAVALQSMRDLDISDENVNVNGGAISMGHPVGASGARVALHLALELGRRGGGLGAAGLCGGGGQGEALLLHVNR
jgi:3-oxoadipyl-CoA thiolase